MELIDVGILDESALRACIEEVVRKVVREEIAADAGRQPAEYVSVIEAARRIGVSPGTIREWVRLGRLTRYPAGRLLRISVRELDALMKAPPAAEPIGTPEEEARRSLERRPAHRAARR
jgi:excisionase family DNA binding protein